jgi:hypothetical protein
MLSDKLIPAACETDLAGAVSMYALTLASGKASALLDWNNNFAEDRNKCVCTHCGNYAKSFVGNDDLKLGPLGVLGRTLGKVKTFGAVYAKVSEARSPSSASRPTTPRAASRPIWARAKSPTTPTAWTAV